VWTETDGILSTDSSIVPEAVTVTHVSYEEASELSQWGGQQQRQGLHPLALQPAQSSNIPIRVKNVHRPLAEGTLIRNRPKKHNDIGGNNKKDAMVTAITYKHDVTVLDLHSTDMVGTYGFLATIFKLFDKHKLSIDVSKALLCGVGSIFETTNGLNFAHHFYMFVQVLASSEVSVSLTLDKNQEDKACVECLLAELDHASTMEITKKVRCYLYCCHLNAAKTACRRSLFSHCVAIRQDGMSILSLISNVERSSDVLATVFRVFYQQKIPLEMMSQGASKVNISFVIPTQYLERAIRYLHDCFFGTQCVVATEQDDKHDDQTELLQEIRAELQRDASQLETAHPSIDVASKVFANATRTTKTIR
jgi:aspartate kinase